MAETVSRRIVLHFPNEILDKPIVFILVKEFELVFNILKAFVVPDEEGLMVMELSGTSENLQKGLDYLKSRNVRIEPLKQSIVRLDDRCYQCGLCTGVCPSGALSLKRPSMEVEFDSDKCVLCGACVEICPARAMKIAF
ncbi:MAG TPA: 4Fe-4S binding protein [bacterium]|nr:4Fe-4S binding protein [bacterium]